MRDLFRFEGHGLGHPCSLGGLFASMKSVNIVLLLYYMNKDNLMMKPQTAL